MIHPSAVIHPKARLHPTVCVEPFAVIDEGVEIGAHCVIGPHVYLTGLTTIGTHNRFHAGCVIGDTPQDVKYDGVPTSLRIGSHNLFREHVTVHRSTRVGEETIIGSHNFLMANCHVAHNCQLGDHLIIANGGLLGGHVMVGDRAFISGNCLVHQFVRVGTLAIMQGGSAISKDLPPFTMSLRVNEICGLNTLGLRRAGYTEAQRLELRQVYHALFRSGDNLRAAVTAARKRFSSAAAKTMIEFVAGAKRGVCADVGRARRIEDDEV